VAMRTPRVVPLDLVLVVLVDRLEQTHANWVPRPRDGAPKDSGDSSLCRSTGASGPHRHGYSECAGTARPMGPAQPSVDAAPEGVGESEDLEMARQRRIELAA